jgi:hypothetical protein
MSLSLKAHLLAQLAEALPIDPERFREPWSPWTASQVSSNLATLLYYSILLNDSDVSLDCFGSVILDCPVPAEDVDFLTNLLMDYRPESSTLSAVLTEPQQIIIQ